MLPDFSALKSFKVKCHVYPLNSDRYITSVDPAGNEIAVLTFSLVLVKRIEDLRREVISGAGGKDEGFDVEIEAHTDEGKPKFFRVSKL